MNIQIEQISTGRVHGYSFRPAYTVRQAVIVTFGGSEGSCWFDMGHDLALKGYKVLSLYYFNKPELSKTLDKVDLSFFAEVLTYIDHIFPESESVTVVGASRGAELALLLAKEFSEVSNVILYSPSAFMFAGTKRASAWVINGHEAPYINFSIRTLCHRLLNRNLALVASFNRELKHSKKINQTLIDISSFEGNILMFAGDDDLTWPSVEMGQTIKHQAVSARSVELYIFKEAGHTFSTENYDGGTTDGNSFAFYNSLETVDMRMKEWVT
ncbi:Acyl-CoA thioesterase 1 [Alkalibacterium sp. AK22]|uniref:acyl-CoA thioester hydrolase/BAAT C-terminal domain-containing protein n=1 Tax=Alkalibacterium sp. AK22 TaxID=1229520 RepID=UPI0004504351|nr:acyl-CoA thioester hydrolase/BAAT C-terminal domain-containing protein [Alkalibacterium sp. AK22]EXJ23885.1 Acyl-CoA thioesterase 1 [Alkalibacterium sp. AK22]